MNESDYLEHYGVRGMHWGMRKGDDGGGAMTSGMVTRRVLLGAAMVPLAVSFVSPIGVVTGSALALGGALATYNSLNKFGKIPVRPAPPRQPAPYQNVQQYRQPGGI